MRIVLFIFSLFLMGSPIETQCKLGYEAPYFFEYHLIDTSRQELYPHDTAHPFRELMMHVWLPHEPKKQYPLILFSHGLGKTYNGMTYTYLCQTIAACGYVVVSVSHAYGCKDIQFPDGRVAHYNFFNRLKQSKQPLDAEVELWVADMIFALNECERLCICGNESLYNMIDTSRIGIVGHSLGGSTALHMCRRDDRVKVAIDLDGPVLGAHAMVPCEKPMLFIIGSSVLSYQMTDLGKVPLHYAFMWRQHFNQRWLSSLNTFIDSLPNGHKIIINGIVHDTFTDYSFTSDPVIQPWLIDGAMAHHAITGYVCEFFDSYFKNNDVYLKH